MSRVNLNDEQQRSVINGTIQGQVPQQQEDPARVIDQQFIDNGNLVITSTFDFKTRTTSSVIIPFSQVPSLFEQRFDNTEENFVINEDIAIEQYYFAPNAQFQMPNIAHYIGYIVIGAETSTKYQESILICCQEYLNGTMEILPSGLFRVLNVRRDGTNRRYSQLCMAIYFSIGALYYQLVPSNSTVVREMQALLQDIYNNTSFTSVLTRLKSYDANGVSTQVNRPILRRWATSIPWHALMYNAQAPMTFGQFLDLFFKLYSINQGKVIRYDLTHPDDQAPHSIIPNDIMFTNVTPKNMVSSPYHISPLIPYKFIYFIRYLMASDYVGFAWRADLLAIDDVPSQSDLNDQNDTQPAESESRDESTMSS